MRQYYLAVDIGASSGRHILGCLSEGKLEIEEIYRFENGMKKEDGHLCWDVEHLFQEVKNGLKCCREKGKIPVSMAIDTWAVDYVLMDQQGERIDPVYAYRDGRTTGMDEIVEACIDPEQLYRHTGIQKQIFNTIYQLMADKESKTGRLERAETMLMIPDYLSYLLTGVKMTEYTNATTTQLVNPLTKDWDWSLIEKLGYKKSLFGNITMAGTEIGLLKPEIAEQVGFQTQVIQPATHDTASAVMAVPATGEDFLYLSSGTWSLLGTERRKADCSRESQKANMTNEGGYEYRFRYLKNIMGLWMIQSVRHEWNDRWSFAELCEMAEKNTDFPSRVDVNDPVFLAPESMIQAVLQYCEKTGQRVPETEGEISAVIYQSLSDCYERTIKEMEELTGKEYDALYVVGGGSNATYLNRLTAEKTKKTVYSGPSEATAIGNLVAQMIHSGECSSLENARKMIYDSFDIKEYRR